MNASDLKILFVDREKLAAEVDQLASEMKLLAINLAVALAQAHKEDKSLESMRAVFSELIGQATDVSDKVGDAVELFRQQKKGIEGIPMSPEIDEHLKICEGIGCTLEEIESLSVEVEKSISIFIEKKKVS